VSPILEPFQILRILLAHADWACPFLFAFMANDCHVIWSVGQDMIDDSIKEISDHSL
jgi:hypothetical protein